MKRIDCEQMAQIGGAGPAQDVLGLVGQALDKLLQALLGGLVKP